MARKEPSVAVIILNWRQPDLTIECVKSFQASNYKNFHVFIVDNGSGDDSVRRFREELSGVEVLELAENYGYAGGCNRASKMVDRYGSFEFFLISNNDLTVERDTLGELVSAAERLGRGNIFTPAMYVGGSEDKVVCGGVRSLIPSPLQVEYRSGKARLGVKEIPYFSGAFFLVERKLFRKLKGFKEDFYMYGEDMDLGLRAKKLGARIYFIPNARIRHKFYGSTGKFSPLSRYYLARNVPRLIGGYSDAKALDYFLFFFWGLFSLPILILILKPKSAIAWLWGLMDFFRGKRGRNTRLERW